MTQKNRLILLCLSVGLLIASFITNVSLYNGKTKVERVTGSHYRSNVNRMIFELESTQRMLKEMIETKKINTAHLERFIATYETWRSTTKVAPYIFKDTLYFEKLTEPLYEAVKAKTTADQISHLQIAHTYTGYMLEDVKLVKTLLEHESDKEWFQRLQGKDEMLFNRLQNLRMNRDEKDQMEAPS